MAAKAHVELFTAVPSHDFSNHANQGAIPDSPQ
jgi:hypothetical protein